MIKKILKFIFVPKRDDEFEEAETLSEIVQIRVTPKQKELLECICAWQHTNKSDFNIGYNKKVNMLAKEPCKNLLKIYIFVLISVLAIKLQH